ncbi:MAG: hypothetical protein KC657_00545 [Myxococcales bacterium]|nr:hypothetical protein [Myxococcales bacterium]
MSEPDDDDQIPSPPPSLVPPADSLPPPVMSSRPPPRSMRSIPPSSRSLPPLPAVEPILEEANAAKERSQWDDALAAYKKALFVVDAKDGASQASIYASIAEVKSSQGRAREAESNFEKALTAFPGHMRSIEGLILLALDGREWERVAEYRKKRCDAVASSAEKVDEMGRIADVYEFRLGDPKRAAETLELAGLIAPGNVEVLRRLKNLYGAMKLWNKQLDVLDELCRADGTSPEERSLHRLAQAELKAGRMRDEPKALAFLELALADDPANDRALSMLVAIRTKREEWAELAGVYERLIDRLAAIGDRERAWDVCRKLGTVRRDRLLDGPGAVDALRGAIELRPEDAESRAALAELYSAKGDRTAAVRELETVARHAPFRAQTYRRLFDLHQRAQRPDRAWLMATCLEELGATDVSHDLVVEQFRPDGPIRPTTGMTDAWWTECLRAPGTDDIVCDVLRAVSRAAVEVQLAELAAKKKLVALDPATKQDKGSTASIVRTFVWAARALDLPLPDLYLVDDVPTGIAAVPAESPATALGETVRRGLTVQQLSFLAGRHLTYYRPEHYPLVFYPTLADITALVLSSVRIVMPSVSVPPPAQEGAERLESAISSRLTKDEKAALTEAVEQLDARGGKLDLLAWIRSVELTATRAGALLAGDLRVVMRLVKAEERRVGELTAEAKRGDLLAFTASEGLALLRERMGVAISG